VSLKAYGMTSLLFVFVLVQSAMLAKYLEKDKEQN
jgi:intracellular septation protein A